MSYINPMQRSRQAGFTLIELAIASVIAVVIMGSVIAVQQTASEGFNGAVGQGRLTSNMRRGISMIKEEIRSVRADSIVVPPIGQSSVVEGAPIITFQQAVSFDVSTGQTTWGGGVVENGTVEYVIEGMELIRQVRDEWGDLVPTERQILHRNLDRENPVIPPVAFLWDEEDGYISMQTRTRLTINNEPITREIDTVIHVESVFTY